MRPDRYCNSWDLTPLRFPTSRIATEEDVTERAAHTVIDVVHDFEHALVDAHTHSRAWQLRDRIKLCIELLTQVQDSATAKIDRLSEEKN